nr:hypothetical protein [Fredinandcohnia onubensis]
MYLTNASLLDIVKKQLFFKVRAYYGTFTSLATVQAIALLFSFNGVGQMGLGGNISISSYSGSMIFVFTAFWAFITAITLSTKPYHYIDFSFVTNRMSSHLSTIGMLIVYSFIASITSTFAGILLRVILYANGSNKIIANHFFLPFSDMLLGIYIGGLYLLLFATIGYLIGMFTQINKLFGFAIPALVIGWAIYEIRSFDTFTGFTFFAHESSILVFTLKIVVTVAVMIWIVIAATNRLEVRK